MTDETLPPPNPSEKAADDLFKQTPPPGDAPAKPAFDVNAMLAAAGQQAPDASNNKQVKSGRIYFPVAMLGQTKLMMNLDVQAVGPFVALMVRFREEGNRQFTVLHARDPKDISLLEKYSLFIAYAAADLPSIFQKLATGGFAQKVLTAVQQIGQRHDAHVTLTMQEVEMRLEAVAQRHLAQHDAILGGMKLPGFGQKPLQVGT